jgi:hypothetical protein
LISQLAAQSVGFIPREIVYVKPVSPDKAALEKVEIHFGNQYVDRASIWRLREKLNGECLFVNKSITFNAIRVQFAILTRNEGEVKCGIVTPLTKFVHRSKSARVILLYQASSEMWDYASDGNLYFEKAVCLLFSEISRKSRVFMFLQ